MEVTIKQIEEIVSVLTEDQQQLLKDTIIHGSWGDDENEFINEKGEIETFNMMAYCTNDAKEAGNFSGRRISAMFRSIYKKLCPENHNQIGRYISHCNDWWGDGSGDMLFIRSEYVAAFETWARESNQIKHFINKWYTYKVNGNCLIIKVTGYDDSNKVYLGGHFTGEKTVIFPTGLSLYEKWACNKSSFISGIEDGTIREFIF